MMYQSLRPSRARAVKVLFTIDGFPDASASLTEDDKLGVMDAAFEEGSGTSANETGLVFLLMA